MRYDDPLHLLRDDLNALCDMATPSLQALRGRRIFMAGCTGFIGKWLINGLLWANTTQGLGIVLILLARDVAAFMDAMPQLRGRDDVVCFQGDCTALAEPMFADIPAFDYAVHALNIHQDSSPDWAARHMGGLARATERLYSLATAKGCTSILFTSSGAAYGTGYSCMPPYAEDQLPSGPRVPAGTVYGETKRFLENYCAALGTAYAIRTVSARCFAFTGAYFPSNGHNALGSFIADASAGRDIYIRGNGKERRSFLHATDMVTWLLALLVRGRHGEAYNVGSERAVPLHTLADLVLRSAGSRAGIVIGNTASQGNALAIYVPETRKIREELALSETVSLEHGLDSTLAWHMRALPICMP